MQPGQTTNNGGGTMEVVAAAPRCQLLLIVLMAAMLLPGMKVSPLLIWRKIARTIELQENIGKDDYVTHKPRADHLQLFYRAMDSIFLLLMMPFETEEFFSLVSHVLIYVYLCTTHMSDAHGGQKKVLDILKLE
ncbi:hypothetical protein STEG23_023900 [Scotinomys teguina]